MIADAWTNQIREWATLESDIKEVWLFGSRARGTENNDSDLDLAVVLAGDADSRLATYICESDRWEQDLQKRLPVRVHVELGDRELCDSIVGPALNRDGVCLYRKVGPST